MQGVEADYDANQPKDIDIDMHDGSSELIKKLRSLEKQINQLKEENSELTRENERISKLLNTPCEKCNQMKDAIKASIDF